MASKPIPLSPLERINLKITRAEQHLSDLRRALTGYLESQPYGAMYEYDPSYGSRVRGLRITEHPPPGFAAYVGDCLHNLRSALDYLAWELVLAAGQTPNDRTEFPIFSEPLKYSKAASIRLTGVSPAPLATVEALQPYHNGQSFADHPLWILHRLSILDKHRSLLLAGAWVEGADLFTVGSRVDPNTWTTVFVRPTALEPDVDLLDYARRSFFVTLQQTEIAPRRPVVEVLAELVQFVRDSVLPELEPFLR